MEEDERDVEEECRALREAYRRKPEREAPPPWRRVQLYINGLTAVGFGPGTDLLLVLSHSGLGVIDCATGLVVARDHEDRDLPDGGFPIWAPGIGPLAGQRVPLAGLWGGGMRTMTPDGWVIHRAAPNWPLECAVLCPPHAHEIEDVASATVLVKDMNPEIRAIGFSDSGNTLVVANTELHLWSRAT